MAEVLSPTQRSIIALAALQKSTTLISVITKQVHAYMVLVSKMCRLKLNQQSAPYVFEKFSWLLYNYTQLTQVGWPSDWALGLKVFVPGSIGCAPQFKFGYLHFEKIP